MPSSIRLLLAASLISVAPIAAAQTPPVATPAPPVMVYKPTSLIPDASVPRTADGKPDLQGAVWATNFFPVFETSPMNPSLVVTEAELKKMVDTMVAGMMKMPDFGIDPEAHEIIGSTDGLPIVRGERRTRLVVLPADGKLPILPEVKKEIAKVNTMDGAKDDPEQRPRAERCIVLNSPPMDATISYNRMRIVQSPGYVVIHSENGDEARIIPFAEIYKSGGGPYSWMGDSIARWEGDTLVVETTRHRAGRVRGLMSKFVVNPDSRLIERYTRVSKDELLYQFTVEDPAAYSAPWLAEYSFYAASTGMFPGACHEHNYSLPYILQGERVKQAKAEGRKY